MTPQGATRRNSSSSDELWRARLLLNAHECATRGHDWTALVTFGSEYPTGVVCRRDCGIPAGIVSAPKAAQ